MKTANLLASALFGSLALAAPLNKRAYVTETVIVVETQIIYTTVWDQPAPATVAPAATTQPGLFYEKPHNQKPSSKAPAPPAYTPPPPAYTPHPQPSSAPAPAPAPAPSSVYTPPPPPPPPSSVYTPPPAPSSVYTPPAPAPPQSSSTPSYGGGGAESNTLQGRHSNVDITVYDTMGAAGACGETLTDDMMIVALGYKGMGPSTYNYMTGEATMPSCGKYINIEYNGVTVKAKIADKCPGCEGEWDIDCSRAVWKALGITEDTRLKANWYTV